MKAPEPTQCTAILMGIRSEPYMRRSRPFTSGMWSVCHFLL